MYGSYLRPADYRWPRTQSRVTASLPWARRIPPLPRPLLPELAAAVALAIGLMALLVCLP